MLSYVWGATVGRDKWALADLAFESARAPGPYLRKVVLYLREPPSHKRALYERL